MSACRIKKNDIVKVIAGKDKGKEGKVLSVNAEKHTAIVEDVNKVTKHAKPSAANQQGGILHQEAPIDISNLMLVVDGKATKVAFRYEDNGDKVRVAKATGKVIDVVKKANK
ncbi:MAG: 50S ribosomal protein L24 [Lachnospira sp.]